MTTISANPSKQRQWTQEVRYAGDDSRSMGFVVGAFGFWQTIDSTGRQEQGAAAARFLLAPTALAATPGLLDGYGQTSDIRSTSASASLFGQLEWSVTDRLRLLPGLRFNYDDKSVDYNSEVYGGLQTTDPALIALQRSVLAPQAYQAGAADTNVSGQLTAAYRLSRASMPTLPMPPVTSRLVSTCPACQPTHWADQRWMWRPSSRRTSVTSRSD